MAQFDAAWLTCEMCIKYITVLSLSLLSVYESSKAHRTACTLVRANSIGDWTTQLDQISQRLARIQTQTTREMSRRLRERISAQALPEHNVIKASAAVEGILGLLMMLDEDRILGSRPNLINILKQLAAIRNKTRGHGALTSVFYRPAAPLLSAAAVAISELLTNLGTLALVSYESESPGAFLLNGSSPAELVDFAYGGEPGSVWWLTAHDGAVPLLSLMTVTELNLDTGFVNGGWNEASLQAEILCYENGSTYRQSLPEYRDSLPPPPSSTDGGEHLVYFPSTAHNLPSGVDRYVHRTELEVTLESLLRDRTHRLISLQGPGGSGKTSLALTLSHGLASGGGPFDYIIWVSARDIDLLVEGPVPRSRQVKDLETFATYLCRLLELPGPDPETACANFLRDGAIPCLVVLDNLETITNPTAVQRFLDDNVVLPSKVLITSRHERFRGDFPVAVGGMEEPEAIQLLLSEARANFCEGDITASIEKQVLLLSNRLPYVIKMLVAQFTHTRNVNQALSNISSHEELMDALFERSFALLPADGQWLYLLLGRRLTCQEWILSALASFQGYRFDNGKAALLRHSLVAERGEGDYVSLALSSLAGKHSARTLIGHELEAEVEILDRILSETYNPTVDNPSPSLHRLWEAIAHRRAIGGLSWEEAVRLGQAVCSRRNEAWAALAECLAAAGAPPDEVRAAFKRSVEAQPTTPEIWRSFSGFELRQGDGLTAARYGARAIDYGLSDLNFALQIAGDLVSELTSRKDIGAAQRDMYVSGVTTFLQARSAELDATGWSRLGWLYLIRSAKDTDPQREFIRKALWCAEQGLRIDPSNHHCKQLQLRTM